MMGVSDAIKRATVRADLAKRETELRVAESERRYRQGADLRRRFVVDHCEPAIPNEYAAWLAGWLQSGGEITHVYDRPFTQRAVTVVGDGDLAAGPLEVAPADLNWLTLRTRPSAVPSLYGALALHVIVPARVPFTPTDVPNTFHGCSGHNTFYFMHSFAVIGHWVPLFTDVRAILEGRNA